MDHTSEKNLIQFKSINDSLISGYPVVPIINLGFHGFADSFYPPELAEQARESAPLICCLDKTTGLVQLKNLTVAADRYNLVDYSYTSSNSIIAQEHWNNFFKAVLAKLGTNTENILEIGSNDGYLLSLFKNFGHIVLGVDASQAMVTRANLKGIRTIQGIFGESTISTSEINKHSENFSLIIANNVINHSNNPINFVKEVASYLNEDGTFIFEVPYWYSTISSLRFDQIYLEHITYFTVESLEHLLKTANLYINDVELVDYHGGSLRVYSSFKNAYSSNKDKFINLEATLNLKEEKTYINYVKKINQNKDIFLKNLENFQSLHPTRLVFGIGAAAKSNTLLTYYGLDTKKINFIVDSSPFKQGKITPVTCIPIKKDEILLDIKSGLGVILAWNLSKTLKEKILNINSNIDFLDLN